MNKHDKEKLKLLLDANIKSYILHKDRTFKQVEKFACDLAVCYFPKLRLDYLYAIERYAIALNDLKYCEKSFNDCIKKYK